MEHDRLPLGGLYIRTDKNGEPSASGTSVRFGIYPKSRVKDEALISLLNDEAEAPPTNKNNHAWTSYKYYIFDDNETDFMWYRDILHDGTTYRGVYFTAYRPNDTAHTSEENCQANNGYHPGTVYWFQYEPMTWQILDERDDKAWLLADACIDAQAYREVVWDNSYVRSSIRKWLNREFLHTAFSARERDAISRETITNNMEDEDVCDGDIPGSDTHDLIHLISVEEADERLPHGARQCTATDYAVCQGAGVHSESGNTLWWLRSPYYTIDSRAQAVNALPLWDFVTDDVGSTDTGIRPALWLKL